MKTEVREILNAVRAGDMSVDDAVFALKKEPFEDICYAKIDLHRGVRQGAPEVIYGAGKTAQQIIGIAKEMRRHGEKTILITRLSKQAADEVGAEINLDYRAEARIGIIGSLPRPNGIGKIVIATGGRYHERERDHRRRGHGGRARQRDRRAGGLSGDRRADQRGLRRFVRRAFRASVDAEFLRQRGIRGEHR